jgi:hypothetical protein
MNLGFDLIIVDGHVSMLTLSRASRDKEKGLLSPCRIDACAALHGACWTLSADRDSRVVHMPFTIHRLIFVIK